MKAFSARFERENIQIIDLNENIVYSFGNIGFVNNITEEKMRDISLRKNTGVTRLLYMVIRYFEDRKSLGPAKVIFVSELARLDEALQAVKAEEAVLEQLSLNKYQCQCIDQHFISDADSRLMDFSEDIKSQLRRYNSILSGSQIPECISERLRWYRGKAEDIRKISEALNAIRGGMQDLESEYIS